MRRRQMIGCVATPEANSGSLPPPIRDQKTNYTSPFSSHLAASCKGEHQLEAKPDAYMSLPLNWKGSKGQTCNFTSLFVFMLYYHCNKGHTHLCVQVNDSLFSLYSCIHFLCTPMGSGFGGVLVRPFLSSIQVCTSDGAFPQAAAGFLSCGLAARPPPRWSHAISV